MLWSLMLAWGAMCSILMIRFTLPLWAHLPELRYVQLPWRWLLCLNVVLALGVVMAFRRGWLRTLVCMIALGSVLWVWHRVLPPWWDNSGDIQEMVDNQQDGVGNEGTDEYVPAGVDPYDVDQNAPPARFEGRGSAKIHVEQWQSEKRLIVADATSPGKLVLRLFNYPLWRVEVNGRAVRTETTSNTGQIVVPVTAGENRVQVTFVEGWDRLVGDGISAVAMIAVILWFLRSRLQRENPLKAES
jgi:hypothetical protein